MRGEPPHIISPLPYYITIRPYYTLMGHGKNVNSQHFITLSKCKKHQNVQITNDENVKSCQNSPSATPPLDFGLKTGSRGTPWNRKNAGPGGSDFAKCRFWPFK